MPPVARAAVLAPGGQTAHEQLFARMHIFVTTTIISTFIESEGSVDYARWRKDLLAAVAAAGSDFLLALEFLGDIPPTALLGNASVLDDSATSFPTETLAQMRQRALMQVIRASLAKNGESMTLIVGCVHAGGRIGAVPQTLSRLDTRWLAAPAPSKSCAK